MATRDKWTLARWKKEADKTYSQRTRLKYSKNGNCTCYTCGHVAPLKTMQLGHFSPRQHLATRFDDENCRIQCYACNMFYGGQPAIFAQKLMQEYGKDHIEKLNRKKQAFTKYDKQDYQRLIEQWKNEMSDMQKGDWTAQ
jgi:hypothetical protein